MSLAPWCVNETWSFERRADGKVIAMVTGRERCPSDIQTPLWMLRNDYEQNLSQAPWFEPDKPQADRERDWALRNPLQNGRLFTWGWADRNYQVEVTEGRFDLPLLLQRDDLMPPEYGWQKCKMTLLDGSEMRTFESFSGPNLVYQWGTQPNGFFMGIKFIPRSPFPWTWWNT